MKFTIWISLFAFMGMLISTSTVAFEPFPSIVDHSVFKDLPRKAQREYVRAMMLALVDLEEGHRQIQKLPNTPANKKLKKTSWLQLEKLRKGITFLIGTIGIPEAQAQSRGRVVAPFSQYCHDIAGNTSQSVTNQGECVIGGWYSTFIHNRSTGAKYCQRPACSVSIQVRERFAQAQVGCGPSKSMMACNPAIYGTQQVDGNGSPICVNVDRVDTQNASLACLIEFEKRPNMEERLDHLVDRLTSNPNGEAINKFNQVSRMIFNICACGPGFADQTRLNADYVAYMQSHRTCYSLLGMMKLYVDRIKSRNLGCNQLVINSSNLETLSTDLSVLENYTNRVAVLGNLQNGTSVSHTNYTAILQNYRSRFVTDAATAAANSRITRNQAVANNDVALDHVSRFDAQLNSVPGNVKAWCPLEQMPVLPVNDSIEPPVVTTADGDGTPNEDDNSNDETSDQETSNQETSDQENLIVVTATRTPPIEILSDPIVFTPIELPVIPLPQITPDDDDETPATCTFDYTITKATPDATTATITGSVTTNPEDHTIDGETISWSLDGQVIEGKTEKTFSHQITVPSTATEDELRGNKVVNVTVPGCSPCSQTQTETPSDTNDDDEDEDEEIGTCGLTAIATTATQFKLKVAVPTSYTVNSVQWSSNVSIPTGTEENATELTLDRASSETTYSVTIKFQEGTNSELTQSCETKYPVGPVTPVQQGGGFAPPQQMPSLQLPSFFIRGVN